MRTLLLVFKVMLTWQTLVSAGCFLVIFSLVSQITTFDKRQTSYYKLPTDAPARVPAEKS